MAAMTGLQLFASGLVLLATATATAAAAAAATTTTTTAAVKDAQQNASEPLIYKQLRFEHNFLEVYRRYQKYLTIEEQQHTLKVKQPATCGQPSGPLTTTTFNYYQNDQVDARNLTYDDIVFEALDRTYLSRWWPSYIMNYDRPSDMARASDPAKISCAKCERELDYLLRSLKLVEAARLKPSMEGIRLSNDISPELLAFLDATANEETGLLLGNHHWTGENWRQCRKRHLLHIDHQQPARSVEFRGRYCVASIRSKRWDAILPGRIAELEKQQHFYYPDQKENYKRFFRIQLGLCLPESCDSRLLSSRPDDVRRLATFKLSEPLRSYDLVHLFCLPDETSELRQLEPSARLFVVFVSFWLLVVLAATWRDYIERERVTKSAQAQAQAQAQVQQLTLAQKLVDIFSILRNCERLFETRSCQPIPLPFERLADLKQSLETLESESKTGQKGMGLSASQLAPKLLSKDLQFLNCIKVLAMLYVIHGHTGMFLIFFARYPLDLGALDRNILQIAPSAVFIVDWFIVMSGFIIAYLMFTARKLEHNTLLDWIYTIVHRWWRLVPIYALIHWFSQSVFIYTSNGPLWDYGTSNMTSRHICRQKSPFWPLLLLSSSQPIHAECITPAWSLANDFIFFLIAPFFLILLYRAPRAGWLTMLGLIGGCVSLRAHRYLTDPRVKSLALLRPKNDLFMDNNWYMWPTYVQPQYRVASFLTGLLAGHYAFMVLSGHWKSSIYVNPAVLARDTSITRSQKEQIILQTKRRRVILFFSSLLTSALTLSSTLIMPHAIPSNMDRYAKYLAAAIYSTSHTTAAISASFVLLSLLMGLSTKLTHIMSWPIWTILARLNFWVLIIQVEVISWFLLSADRANVLTDMEFFKSSVQNSAFVYLISIVLTVVFELPVHQLEKYFIYPIFNRKPKAPSMPTSPATLPPSTKSSDAMSKKK